MSLSEKFRPIVIICLATGAAAVFGIYLANRPGAELVSVDIDITKAQRLGSVSARISIVEFGDYQCPHCAEYQREVFPEIRRTYVQTGEVQYVFMDFQLEFNGASPPLAEIAHCAGDQGKFWELHDWLYRKDVFGLYDYAKQVGIDTSEIQECASSGKYGRLVAVSRLDGERIGVSGTPTLFIGLTRPKSVMATKVFRGVVSFGSVAKEIEEALAHAGP